MKKTSFKYIFFIVIMYILIFQNYLQNIIKPFQYFDEVLALFIVPALFVCSKKQSNVKKKDFTIITCLLVIFGIGILSNCLYKIQPWKVVYSDILIFYKFFLVYYLSSLLWKHEFLEKYSDKILFHSKLIIRILFCLTIANYIFQLWPGNVRFGIMSNRLFYTHQTMLVGVCIFLFAMINAVKKEKNVKLDQILLLILLLTTLRFKALGAVFIILFIIYYVTTKEKKISISKYVLALFFVIILAWDQISYYYIDLEYSARNQLTIKSFEIAKDYFPLGTGFGTYGCFVSSENYSPLYYTYGLSHIHGLTPGKADFISDTFWPMIFGQFGFIGTLIYLYVLFIIFKKIQDEFSKENMYIYISKITCLVYLLISSTSESAFVHPLAIPLAIILGINVKKNGVELNEEK